MFAFNIFNPFGTPEELIWIDSVYPLKAGCKPELLSRQVTPGNRPHNAFADTIWSMAMKAKREADKAKPISDLEKEYLTVTALQRPSKDEETKAWNIDKARQAELSKIVAAAVDLSLTASRSGDFKAAIYEVIQGILDAPLPEEGWT